MKLILSLIVILIICSCNFSYNLSSNKKENPVNVSIIKTDKGFEYYVGNELVNEFTKENCDEKEMELLDYIYMSCLEERDNKPKEQRVTPKKKTLVENIK